MNYAIVESASSNGYHVAQPQGKCLHRSVPLTASDRMSSSTAEQCAQALERPITSIHRLKQEAFFIIANLNRN